MVNKCSVVKCKTLRQSNESNNNVKLHRFPLQNDDVLPIWIMFTRKPVDWKPSKSSRLCGNHFEESEYVIGHGKGILKPTAIPTISYRQMKHLEPKRLKPSLREVGVARKNDSENFRLNNEDVCNSQYETLSEAINNQITSHKNSINEIIRKICNRENQPIAFTRSFDMDDIEAPRNKSSLVESSLSMQENDLQREISFKFDEDGTTTFGTFVDEQLNKLRPHKETYSITKYKIQELLKNAQLRIDTNKI